MEIAKTKNGNSTYAEYVALSEAVSEIKFVLELMKSFNVELIDLVKVFDDNTGAINIANYGNFTKNSKHIEIHYHYVHESVKENEIVIIKIDWSNNIADIFTKALHNDKLVGIGSCCKGGGGLNSFSLVDIYVVLKRTVCY